MSKLSFRARAVDSNRRMPVFLSEELPDLSEYVSINRTVPQMPTGMEKEEETEFHLQQAISAQQRVSTGNAEEADFVVIPIPKVTADVGYYDRLYPTDYRLPKQLIKVQAALNLEIETPDYDLDSDDEKWLQSQKQRVDISAIQFERVMDTLEKQSEYQVIKPGEARLLLQEDDDVLFTVYDYWLAKRYKAASQGRQLMPRVKSEKRECSGINGTNPYSAFRRRAEKMQTRKNRRNDEESYEKILQLRLDLQKAVTLAEMVKRREKSKREMINLNLDLTEKRFLLKDFNENVFSQVRAEAKPSFQFSKHEIVVNPPPPPPAAKKQTPTKKRKLHQQQDDRGLVSREWLLQNAEEWNKPHPICPSSTSGSAAIVAETAELACHAAKASEEEAGGRFVFKRRRGCRYYAPVKAEDNEARWPWEQPYMRLQYSPACLHSRRTSNSSGTGLRYVGLLRRRTGRGGRLLFDRRATPISDERAANFLGDLPSTSSEAVVHRHALDRPAKDQTTYYRPESPVLFDDYHLDELRRRKSSVPSATVVGPDGILTLPFTIGSIGTADAYGHERKGDNYSAIWGRKDERRVDSSSSSSHNERSEIQIEKSIIANNQSKNGESGKSNLSQRRQHPSSTILPARTSLSLDINCGSMTNSSIDVLNYENKEEMITKLMNTSQQKCKKIFGATTALLMGPPAVRLLPPYHNYQCSLDLMTS